MKSIGRREMVAIGVVTMVTVLLAGWFALVNPVSSKVSGLKTQAEQQQQTNDSVRTQIAVLQADKKKLPQEQADLAKLAERVPATAELPDLLRQMQQASKDSGVALKGITPIVPALLAGATGIDTVGVTLIVSGGYSEIEAFDGALESLSRAFLVSGFTLTSGATPGAAAGSSATSTGDISATFTGRVLLREPAVTSTTAG